MRTSTLEEFVDKIQLEHDLQEESFITPAEMVNYVNEGIDWAESIVVGLYEDYYLEKTEWLAIEDEVDLPENIYANKLRRVEVTSNADATPVRSRQLFKNRSLSDTHVGYNIYHPQGSSPVLTFENLPDGVTHYRLQYTRNANRVTEAEDIIDLPEIALYYAQKFVKLRCEQKERDSQSFNSSAEIVAMAEAMENTLSNMTDDGSEQLEPDLSFYHEFDVYQEF